MNNNDKNSLMLSQSEITKLFGGVRRYNKKGKKTTIKTIINSNTCEAICKTGLQCTKKKYNNQYCLLHYNMFLN